MRAGTVEQTESSFKQRVRVLLSEGVKPDQMCVMGMPSATLAMVFLVYTDPVTDVMQRPNLAIIDDCERQATCERFEGWLVEELARLAALKAGDQA